MLPDGFDTYLKEHSINKCSESIQTALTKKLINLSVRIRAVEAQIILKPKSHEKMILAKYM